MERVCERCAGEDEELVLVRRAGADGPEAPGGSGTTELWCSSCRSDHRVEIAEEQP